MRKILTTLALASGLALSFTGYAQAPAGAPAGTTGVCKDGSYASSATKKGACAKHGGVKDWYGAEEGKSATKKDATEPKKEATEPKGESKSGKGAASAPRSTPAAGGGAGKVWVNTASKVYHCQGTKWYGTTKKGEYMTESDAKAAGNHADHGKACS